MDAILRADTAIALWLNHWVGHFPPLDAVMKVFISDYFTPTVLSLCLLGMWFTGKDAVERGKNQRTVIIAMAAMGFANLAVLIINQHFFRLRPFAEHEMMLLFYEPTDSSFPANPAAVAFAMATGVWLRSHKMALVFALFGVLWAFGRVYAGVFYPLDVLGGAAIGVVIAILVAIAMRLIEPIPTWVLRAFAYFHLA